MDTDIFPHSDSLGMSIPRMGFVHLSSPSKSPLDHDSFKAQTHAQMD